MTYGKINELHRREKKLVIKTRKEERKERKRTKSLRIKNKIAGIVISN